MKACKTCSKPCIGDYCMQHKPRKPLKTTTTLKPRKRLKKLGKIGKQLIQQRQDFILDVPPPYYCIYCIFMEWDMPPLDVEVMNVEHTESKARHPELRFVKGKLAISCPFHNEDKASLDIDQYLAKLQKEKEAQHGQTKPDSTYQADQ